MATVDSTPSALRAIADGLEAIALASDELDELGRQSNSESVAITAMYVRIALRAMVRAAKHARAEWASRVEAMHPREAVK